MPEENQGQLAVPAAALQAPPDEVLVTAIEEEGGMSVWPDRKASPWASNIQPTNDTNRALLVACQMKADVPMEDVLNTWQQVEQWFAHKVELRDEKSGEVRQATRLVLVSPQGQTLSTVSGPFANGWRFVLQAYGNGPYQPPLEVKPYKVQSRNGPGGYYQFRVRRQGEPEKVNPPPPEKPVVKVRTKANPTGE